MKRFLLFLVAIMAAGMSMMNASTCADLNAITGTVNNFSLGQVTVVYAKSPYYFVQDATGTTLVYKANYGLQAGDVVTGLSGKATLYNSLPELTNPTDYSSLSITQGTAPVIPDATVVPTMADINKVFMFRDVDMGGQSFRLNANNNPINLDVTFLGQTLQFRNGWKDTITFNANKTYDMVGAISRYNETLQVYVTDFVEHHETGFNPIVVGAEKPSTWNAMYLYAWKDNNEGTLLGAWPGTLVSVDSTGWAYKTFEGVSAVNYIWNNGSGTQTADLYTTASICQRLVEPQPHLSSGNWSATAVECGSHATQPSDTTSQDTIPDPGTGITLGFGNTFAWDSVYLYAWDDNQNPLLGQWPGTLMTLNENQWAYKTFTGVDKVNYIWSNGKNSNAIGARQTRDLTATASVCQAVDPYSANYPLHVVSIECDANPDYIFDLTYAQALAIGALADVNNASYYTYRTTGVVSHIQTSPENVDRYKNCDFYIVNPNDSNDNSIQCFRTRWLQDTDMTSEVMPAVGDTVTIVGSLQYYQSRQVEFNRGYIQSIARQFTPDTIAPQPGEGITVGFLKPADWEKVQLTDGYNGAWTYTDITPDQDGWCYYTFESRDSVYYQWGNGWDSGTIRYTDMISSRTSICHRTTAFKVTEYGYEYDIIPVECGSTEPLNGLKVRMNAASVSAQNWSNLYLYAWDTNGPILGQWPGAQLVNVDGWYEYQFFGKDSVNIVWNDAVGLHAQTHDINGVAASTCYQLGATLGDGYPNVYYDYSVVDCNGGDTIAPQPQTGFTVKLLGMSVPAEWNEVRIYSWTPGVDPAVSTDYGLLLTEDSLGWYSYTFQNVDTVDFLYNNGAWGETNQTIDARIVSDVCVALGDPNTTPSGRYPLVAVDCIHPDTITPTPIDTGKICTVYIFDNITRVYYDSLKVQYGQDAVLPTESLPTYDGYHFVFWEGLYDGSNVIRNVKSDVYALAKYYINLPEQTPANPVTVRLDPSSVPESWENVYVYSWTAGAMEAQWPGTAMTVDATGWLAYTFPAGVEDIDFLFNNGNGNTGNQTVDVDDVNSNYYFRIDNPLGPEGLYMVYPTQYTPQPEDTTGILVRFFSPQQMGWQSTKYIYAWVSADSVDTPILGEWPGQLLVADTATGWMTYRMPSQYTSVNVVINAVEGYCQTEDILNITTDVCLGILNEQYEWYNEMCHYTPEVLDCAHSAKDYCRVVFADADNYIVAYRNVLSGDSVKNVPAGPERHGYDFIGWDKDLTNVTTSMIVRPLYEEQPATTNLKVHLVPTNGIGWQQVYLYAWTNTPNGDFGYEVCGTWPGVQVPVDSLGWCTYTFAHDSLVNIIWNDGVSGENLIHQTANIMNVNTETYYRLFGTDEYSKAAVDVLNPLSNPSEFHTVAFIDYDFDAELLSIQQIHHGQNIIDWPSAPQHDGYTFLNWVQLDPVTMQAIGIVTDTTSVTGDMIIDESYERVKYMVYMVDWDGRLLYFGEVPYGNNVNMEGLVPYYPREGYEFIGWSDSLQNITSMRFSVALYKPVTTGNYTVVYQGLNGQMIDRQMIDLMLPMAEEIDGYMFVGWKVVEGDLSYGIITIQAMYQWVGPDGAPEVAGENRATKELREGKVYVISPDGKVYDAEGKLVETK